MAQAVWFEEWIFTQSKQSIPPQNPIHILTNLLQPFACMNTFMITVNQVNLDWFVAVLLPAVIGQIFIGRGLFVFRLLPDFL
jgi:hypothetical protein